MVGDKQGEQPTSNNATTEDVANSESQNLHEIETPQYRQPSAHVQTNPNAARPPRKYAKYEEVWVYRENYGWMKAKVIRWLEDSANSWEYQLEDKEGQTLWKDQKTWFSEEELDRFQEEGN